MGDELQVPTCIAGSITNAGISFCQDGATHLIETASFGFGRLVPQNDDIKTSLDQYVDKDVIVYVCGYSKKSAECQHLEVYYVGSTNETAPKLESLAG